jgi:8-oxo-dGTP pyrophosphatase MutT (NUDIX family)
MNDIKDKRRTFYLDDDDEKPLRAGGVIIYKYVDESNIELLLISSRGQYEDIGGCTDINDTDIFDTVSREVEEETNEVITYNEIIKRLHDSVYVYSKSSKYIIFIVQATEEEENLNTEDFGNKEIHDDISRTISWISLSTVLDKDIIRYKLNYRMKNPYLFDKLRNIKKNATRSIRMI